MNSSTYEMKSLSKFNEKQSYKLKKFRKVMSETNQMNVACFFLNRKLEKVFDNNKKKWKIDFVKKMDKVEKSF